MASCLSFRLTAGLSIQMSTEHVLGMMQCVYFTEEAYVQSVCNTLKLNRSYYQLTDRLTEEPWTATYKSFNLSHIKTKMYLVVLLQLIKCDNLQFFI